MSTLLKLGLAGVEMLKRRLNRIMDGGTPKKLSSSGKVALVFAGLLLLSLRPNLAQTDLKPANEKKTKGQPAAKAEPADTPAMRGYTVCGLADEAEGMRKRADEARKKL